MKKLTLEQIVEGVRHRDNRILTIIYKEIFPVVRHHVLSNGGTQEDAKDVFQESIIIIFKQINKDGFKLKTGFEAYLFGIARHVWLKILRNKSIHARNVVKMEEPEVDYFPPDVEIEDDIEMRLFRRNFLKLGEDCQKLLKMITDEKSKEEIINSMGYKNEKTVRNKKYKCKEFLVKLIKADPEYKFTTRKIKK